MKKKIIVTISAIFIAFLLIFAVSSYIQCSEMNKTIKEQTIQIEKLETEKKNLEQEKSELADNNKSLQQDNEKNFLDKPDAVGSNGLYPCTGAGEVWSERWI